MIKTPICDLLGIEYPVLQGGMAWIADGKLAAAVSNGGGLGVISAMNAAANYLRQQIKIARSLTDMPFGVNIMLMSRLPMRSPNGCGRGSQRCNNRGRKPFEIHETVAGKGYLCGACGGVCCHGASDDPAGASALIAEAERAADMWERPPPWCLFPRFVTHHPSGHCSGRIADGRQLAQPLSGVLRASDGNQVFSRRGMFGSPQLQRKGYQATTLPPSPPKAARPSCCAA